MISRKFYYEMDLLNNRSWRSCQIIDWTLQHWQHLRLFIQIINCQLQKPKKMLGRQHKRVHIHAHTPWIPYVHTIIGNFYCRYEECEKWKMKNINKMLLKGAVQKCARKMIFARLDDIGSGTSGAVALGGRRDNDMTTPAASVINSTNRSTAAHCELCV